MSAGMAGDRNEPVPISDVMETELITIGPEMETLAAMDLMMEHRISCLPVVKEGKLVGIVTEGNFTDVARQLFGEFLGK